MSPQTDPPEDLPGQLEELRGRLADLERAAREQLRLEESLRQEHDFTASLLDTLSALVVVLDREGRIGRFNRACERATGYAFAEVRGAPVLDLLLLPEEIGAVRAVFADLTAGHFPNAFENHWRTRAGGRRLIAWSNTALLGPTGRVELVIGTGIDVTEQRRLEGQLRQAQKMEAVGRLAGGVAHDFNNLLTSILGYAELLLAGAEPGTDLSEGLDEIRRAGTRAAALTGQLLSFSRKREPRPRAVAASPAVAEARKLLGRLLGEDVELVVELGATGRVVADPVEFQQVLMNLAVNARDAMPRGGTLTLRTADLPPGEGGWVLLEVGDTGSGMTEEVRAQIFEPFFTTKGERGTGIGLSTVHDIVAQAGGRVEVESAPGRGTTFRVFWPRAVAAAEGPAAARPASPAGRETVLVVDDDAGVRALARAALAALGYTVLEAASGVDALEACAQHAGPVHLLATDVVLPRMGGRELAARVAELRPGVRLLYLSGYGEDEVADRGVRPEEAAFLPKPFTGTALARKVREVLDARPAPTP